MKNSVISELQQAAYNCHNLPISQKAYNSLASYLKSNPSDIDDLKKLLNITFTRIINDTNRNPDSLRCIIGSWTHGNFSNSAQISAAVYRLTNELVSLVQNIEQTNLRELPLANIAKFITTGADTGLVVKESASDTDEPPLDPPQHKLKQHDSVGQVIRYADDMPKLAQISEHPITGSHTIEKLQEEVLRKEQELFVRAWNCNDAIRATALADSELSCLHMSLTKHPTKANSFVWRLSRVDAHGSERIYANKTVKKHHCSLQLDTGLLNTDDFVLDCTLQSDGKLIITRAEIPIRFKLSTTLATEVHSASFASSTYLACSAQVEVCGQIEAKKNLVIDCDLCMKDGAKIIGEGKVGILTQQTCDIKDGKISAKDVLKVYAPGKCRYELSNLASNKMVDLSLAKASDLQLVSDYQSNLTYAVLNAEPEELCITQSLDIPKELYILAPNLGASFSHKEAQVVNIKAGVLYLHVQTAKLNKAFMHARDLGFRCAVLSVGEIYTELDAEGLYKISGSQLIVDHQFVLAGATNFNMHGGDALLRGNQPSHIAANKVHMLYGKFVAKAPGMPTYLASKSLNLDILKSENPDFPKHKRNGNIIYNLLHSIKARTKPSFFSVNGELLIPDDAAIVNNSGNLKAPLRVSNLVIDSLQTFEMYSATKHETVSTHVGTRRFLGIKTGNKYTDKQIDTPLPNHTENVRSYTAVTLVDGKGELNIGDESINVLNGNLLAYERDLELNGLHIGRTSATFDSRGIAEITVLQDSDYAPGLRYSISDEAEKYFYSSKIPLQVQNLPDYPVLVLEDSHFRLVNVPATQFEFDPEAEVNALVNLFLSKYKQMNLMGLRFSDEQLRNWLHTNAGDFYNEANKLNGKLPINELNNLSKPLVYFVPYNMRLANGSTRSILRLVPHLPDFMLDPRLLSNMGAVIAKTAKITASCTVTGLLKLEHGLTADMVQALTVQKLVYESTREVVDRLRVGRKSRISETRKTIDESLVQEGGIIEANKLSGKVGVLESNAGEFNIGQGGVELKTDHTRIKQLQNVKYEPSTSDGYIGRDKAYLDEHLANRTGVKTVFNSSGPIKIEALVGNIIDETSILNCTDDPELIALRGELISYVVDYINDPHTEFAQEKAKNWLERNFSKRKVFETIRGIAAGAAVVCAASTNVTAMLVGAALSVVAFAADQVVRLDDKAKLKRDKEANEEKANAEKITAANRIEQEKQRLLAKITRQCQNAKNEARYKATIAAHPAGTSKQTINAALVPVLQGIEQHYSAYADEVRRDYAAKHADLESNFNNQIRLINENYAEGIESINSAPGPTIGIGAQISSGSTGYSIGATYTSGYDGNTHTSAPLPVYNYDRPYIHTSQNDQPVRRRDAHTVDDDFTVQTPEPAPAVNKPAADMQESRARSTVEKLSQQEKLDEFFASYESKDPIRDSVEEFMHSPYAYQNRRDGQSTVALLWDASVAEKTEYAASYLLNTAYRAVQFAVSPIQMLAAANAAEYQQLTDDLEQQLVRESAYMKQGKAINRFLQHPIANTHAAVVNYFDASNSAYQQALTAHDYARAATIKSNMHFDVSETTIGLVGAGMGAANLSSMGSRALIFSGKQAMRSGRQMYYGVSMGYTQGQGAFALAEGLGVFGEFGASSVSRTGLLQMYQGNRAKADARYFAAVREFESRTSALGFTFGKQPTPKLTRGKILEYLQDVHNVPVKKLYDDLQAIGLELYEPPVEGIYKLIHWKTDIRRSHKERGIKEPIHSYEKLKLENSKFIIEIHKGKGGPDFDHMHITDANGNVYDKNLNNLTEMIAGKFPHKDIDTIIKKSEKLPEAHIRIKEFVKLNMRPYNA